MRRSMRQLTSSIAALSGRPAPWVRRGLLGVLAIAVVAVAAAYFADEPIRRVIERQMNQRLKGFSATIRAVSFHPIGLSLTVQDLVFTQNAHPNPPVLRVTRLDASVQWKALIHGKLVADFRLVDPALYVNRQQLQAEAADPTPLQEHGWQEAFEAIYPLKINEVRITTGSVTYVDDGPFKPLEITRLAVAAQNIRNIRSKERTYPSDLHLEGVVFQSGRIIVDGQADFLAEPIPGIRGDLALERIELDYFKPVLSHGSVSIQGGMLSAAGAFEYGPTVRVADLKQATITNVRVDYVHTPQTVGVPEKVARKTVQAAEATNIDRCISNRRSG
jgi:hypothetical protein